MESLKLKLICYTAMVFCLLYIFYETMKLMTNCFDIDLSTLGTYSNHPEALTRLLNQCFLSTSKEFVLKKG